MNDEGDQVRRAPRHEPRREDVDAEQALQEQVPPDVVRRLGARAVDRRHDEEDRQRDDRAGRRRRDQRGEGQLQDEKRQERRDRPRPPPRDEAEREPLGEVRLDQDRAQDERHDVEPDDVEPEDPEDVVARPHVEEDEEDDQRQRRDEGGDRLGHPPDESEKEAGEGRLPRGGQPGRRRGEVDGGEDGETSREAEVPHPPLGGSEVPLRGSGELRLREVEEPREVLLVLLLRFDRRFYAHRSTRS